MDRKSVPGSARRNPGRKRAARAKGLQLIERDGYWHIHGSVRIEGRTIRVRTSTGLAARPDNEAAAHDELLRILSDLRREIIHGIKPSIPVSSAAARYLKRPRSRGEVGAATIANVQAIVRHFATRQLDQIAQAEWTKLVEVKTQGRAPATRERFVTTVLSFLNWCQAEPNGWIQKVPRFDRDRDARNPNRRARRRVGELRPDLVRLMIDHAAIHMKAQMAVMWSTGARVSSILYGCRVCDLILAPGREQIMFHDTKNGTTVPAALTPYAADVMREYLKWRKGLEKREDPLFLTHLRLPYEDNGKAAGGQTKTAFHAMRRRTIKTLFVMARQAKAEGRADEVSQCVIDARLVRQITPHWFRHALASGLIEKTGNFRIVMDQGGWLDVRSVMGYVETVDATRRAAINAHTTGTVLTRDESDHPKRGGKPG